MLEEVILNTKSLNVSVAQFIINLLIAIFCSYILEIVYTKFGRSLSNRKSFSYVFPILTTTTMIVICIVKSSLALSLGLVGALSIVRFRTPVKEPEELTYLFLAIALGLGFGANQTVITSIGFIVICSLIAIRSNFSRSKRLADDLSLILRGKEIDVDQIISVISPFCNSIKLKRLSENNENSDIHFSLGVKSYNDFLNLKLSIKEKLPDLSINFIDNSNIFN